MQVGGRERESGGGEKLKIGKVRETRKGDRGWSLFSIMTGGKEARVGTDADEDLGERFIAGLEFLPDNGS